MGGLDLRRAAMLSALAATLQLARFASLDHRVDDAWISFRIARTWLDLGVLTFDATRAPVEGMSNLLWTLLSAAWIAAMPSVDPSLPARALGALLHLGTVLLVVRAAAALTGAWGGRPAWGGLTAGLLFAGSGWTAFYALSGLETPLWSFLLAASVERLWPALAGLPLPRGRLAAAGLLLGLLAMTRPEGVLLGTLVVGALLAGRSGWPALGVFLAMVGALEAFRLWTYGSLVPNTFFAKGPAPAAGLLYAGSYLLWGLGLLGPALAAPLLRRSAGARLVVLILAVMLAGVAWSGGDWMPGYRRCTEAVVGLAVLAGAGAGMGRWSWRRALPAVAWALGLAATAARGADAGSYDLETLARLGRAARATAGVDTVALVDIGIFGWEYGGSVLDLAGLTDAHIARLRGAHAAKPWDEAYFRERAPDLLVVRSETPVRDPLSRDLVVGAPERGMLLSVLEGGGYRYHGQVAMSEGRFLLLFFREGLVVPAALWGPPAPRDLRDLLMERGG